MEPGDRVTVSSSVVVYTHPEHRGRPFDLQGQEGEVVSVIDSWKGRPLSPTLPVVVAVGKFRAHFRDDELTKV
ncbi:MAG: ferredoxin-thioredoxin reductase variable chain [Cyanobacteriota bacterium]